jgi:hypothetical protein
MAAALFIFLGKNGASSGGKKWNSAPAFCGFQSADFVVAVGTLANVQHTAPSPNPGTAHRTDHSCCGQSSSGIRR